MAEDYTEERFVYCVIVTFIFLPHKIEFHAEFLALFWSYSHRVEKKSIQTFYGLPCERGKCLLDFEPYFHNVNSIPRPWPFGI